MGTATELIKAIADVSGIAESHLNSCARYAREAGLLSQAGRGVNAARMTVTDASNLLIAACAAPLAVNTVKTIGAYRSLASVSGLFYFVKGTEFGASSFGDDLDRFVRMAVPGVDGDCELLQRLREKAAPPRHRKKAVERAVEAGKVVLPTPRLFVEFRQPPLSAAIYTKAANFYSWPNVNAYESEVASYGPTDEVGEAFDRHERVIISERTLLAIGRVLSSDQPVPAAGIPVSKAKRGNSAEDDPRTLESRQEA